MTKKQAIGKAITCWEWITRGKLITKKCHCGNTYIDFSRKEKRHIPVCDNCLPF